MYVNLGSSSSITVRVYFGSLMRNSVSTSSSISKPESVPLPNPDLSLVAESKNPSLFQILSHVSRYQESSVESGDSVTQTVAVGPHCVAEDEEDLPTFYHYVRYDDVNLPAGIEVKNLVPEKTVGIDPIRDSSEN